MWTITKVALLCAMFFNNHEKYEKKIIIIIILNLYIKINKFIKYKEVYS